MRFLLPFVLIAMLASSCANDIVKEIPEAAFGFRVDSLSVEFNSSSTGEIDAWTWDFGDGKHDIIENPTYVFDSAGTYTVTLIVSNGVGDDRATHDVTVP